MSDQTSPLAAPPAGQIGPDEVQVFPASSAQQRFWILDQLDETRSAYTIPLALRLAGALDVGALTAAFNLIVERHEALRTVFAVEGDDTVQILLPTLIVDIGRVNLADLPRVEREGRVLDAAANAANQAFDLARGPLLRVDLIELASDEHVLLVTLHHIIADGWSIGVLFRELQLAYGACLDGLSPDLPPLPVQYPDYAVWQRRMMTTANATRQLEYWKSALGGHLPVLELPADRPRPAVLSNTGAKRELFLAAEVVEPLRTLGRAEGATPYMSFLAAFFVLLQRYTVQDDLIVGSLTAGRNRPELEPLIGLFLNTVAIRVDAAPSTSFREVLGRVRDAATAAMANQDVPFEEVVEALGTRWDRSRSPVFQAAFQLLDSLTADPKLRGLEVTKVPLMKETAKFELTLMLSAGADRGMRAVMEYNSQLFEADTIDRMLRQFQVLLGAIVATPDRPIGTLNLIPPAELDQVTATWNATASQVATDLRVEQLFAAQAARTPAAIAVVDADTSLTYAELDVRANVLAARLREFGAGPGVLIGISLERSVELVVAVLAVMKAGGAYLPLDPDYPADRLAFIVRDSGVGIVIVEPATRHALPAEGLRQVIVRDAASGASPEELASEPAGHRNSPNDLAYVIYTSGSTGRPKGVEIEQRNLVNFLAGMDSLVPLGCDDRIVAVTPLSFDISALELLLPLVNGASVIVASRATAVDGRSLGALLDRCAATHLQATPSTWRLLVESGWRGRPGMVALSGGEALPPALADALLSRGVDLWNLYGPTEATIWATAQHLTGIGSPVRIGRPMANVRTYVLDTALRPVPVGVPGELWLGGDGLARGYRGRADLTAERFRPDLFSPAPAARMYRTGDRARWHADATLEYLGRMDFQVKLRGHRIELGEIESVLAQHPDVLEAVAMVREDGGGDARLVAYVTVRDQAPAWITPLRGWLRDRLPEVMVPAAIVVVERFPMTPNGKIDRKALPAPGETARQETEYVAPRTDFERQVAAAWSDVLRIERVGINDDFFDLGGHSLAAMRILARLSGRVPERVTLATILKARTVAALAAEIESAAATAAAPGIHKRPDIGPAPLSHPQQLLWLFEQMTPGTATYNIPMVRRIKGSLDFGVFDRALTAVVARHEILRTLFEEIDGEVRQLVQPARSVSVTVIDLRADPDPEAGAQQALKREASRPFDLRSDPMLRAAAVRLRDDDTLLLLVAHHIAFDGGSVGVLMRDLGAFYERERKSVAPALAPLPIQFADYATWERTAAREMQLEQSLGYWRTELAGAPGTVDLPTDRPRTADPSGPGARHVTTLQPALTTALHALAREHDATLFMVLLAGFQALLHRYSGQDDLVVGAAIAGRLRAETENLIGYFANTLALRAQFDETLTFADHLANVRRRCLSAYEHQDVPYEKIVLDLRPGRGQADAGLFSVMFVLQDGESAALRLGDADIAPAPVDLGVAKFDLSLSMAETPAGLRLSTEYRSDLFDAETVRRLTSHFEALLRTAVMQPERELRRLPLLTTRERHRLLVDWNSTQVDYPAGETLLDLLEAQAARTPEAVAAVDASGWITYAQLHARSLEIGRWLQCRSAGPGTLVGVCVDRSIDLLVAVLGVIKAGAAYVPLDPDYPSDRLSFMLADSNATALLTEEKQLATLPGYEGPTLLVDCEIIGAPGQAAGLPRPEPDQPAYMIYTSGSTGRPKGAVNSQRGVVNRLRWMQDEYRLSANDTVLQKTPTSFDVSVWELFWPLISGARLVMAAPGSHKDPASLATTIHSHGVTVLHFVPSMLAAFLDEPTSADACGSVRDVVCSGEALPATLSRRFFERFPHTRLHNLYGPTEAAIDVSYHACRPTESGVTVPIGRPVANTQLYILDGTGEPTPVGVAGELHIGGVQVGLGYHNRPDLTVDRFVPDRFADDGTRRLYRTGDRARWLANGEIEFLGRLDFQVKLRGQRIELGEVEAALSEQPGVATAVVTVREDISGDTRLVGYYVAAKSASVTNGQLLSALRRKLPPYMVPSLLMQMPTLALSPSGKVDRRALPAPDVAGVDDSAPYTEPSGPLEQVIAGIWSEVLRVPRVSVEQDFFALGGHSLLATQVVARITRLLRTRATLLMFFEHPTVREMAAALAAASSGQVEKIAAAVLRLREMSASERDGLRAGAGQP